MSVNRHTWPAAGVAWAGVDVFAGVDRVAVAVQRLHDGGLRLQPRHPFLELTLADRESGTTEEVPAGWLFVFIGASPRTDWLGPDVVRDEKGFLVTGQDLLGHGQCGLGFDRRWPRRDQFLQRFDPARHKGAAPEPNRILAHPERLGDLGAGPARQGEHDRPRPVRLAAIPRVAQGDQPLPLLCVYRNR